MAAVALAMNLAAASAASTTDQIAEYEGAGVEQALQVCAALASKSRRLSCFEALAKAAEEATPVSSSIDSQPPSRITSAPSDSAPAPEAGREIQSSGNQTRFVIVTDGGNNDTARSTNHLDRFEAQLAKVWLQNERIYVRLDNGEIWKQTSRDRPRLPKAGQRAAFSKGVSGWLVSFGRSSQKHSFTRLD